MRKIILTGVVLLAMLGALIPGIALAQYPCLFYGTVTVDEELVGAGVEVAAYVEGEQVASTTTDAEGKYSLTVSLESAKEVSFKILWEGNWLDAEQTAMWEMFAAKEVNLTAHTAPKELASISATPSPIQFFIGDTQQLTVTAHYTVGPDQDVTDQATYASDNEAVATVNASGLVTAVAKGSANINISYTEDTVTKTTSVPVTVANRAPAAPTDPLPADGATHITRTLELSVLVSDPDNDPMTVTFYNAADDSVIGTKRNVASGTRAVATWSGLDWGTTYSWYATAFDGEDSTTSDTWSFTTVENVPPSVHSPSPADGATNVSTSPELSVLVTDPNGDLMTVFFYVTEKALVIGPVSNVASGTRASVTVSGLDYGATYHWYVRVNDGINPAVTSDTWSFTTVTNNPPTATEPSPEDGATMVSISPELSVLATDLDGDTMTVTFYNAADDSVIGTVTDVASGTRPTVTWSGLNYNTTYSWYVKISDGINPEQTSATWSFTTMPVPPKMELVSGANIIAYTGATRSLPEALTNIGPDGLDVVNIIWARGAWTNGQWLFYNARIPWGTLTQLENGRAYIIVVTQDCEWELPQ